MFKKQILTTRAAMFYAEIADLASSRCCTQSSPPGRRAVRQYTITSLILSYFIDVPIILYLRRNLQLILITSILILSACNSTPDESAISSGTSASIEPDYSGITIPPNIAPLNFMIKEKGKRFFIRISAGEEEIGISSEDGNVIIPPKKWKNVLTKNKGNELHTEIYVLDNDGNWIRYTNIVISIAVEEVDPYLYYRLLYPGYESWAGLSINRRDLSGFKTASVIENAVSGDNCINCHSFNNGRTDDFLFHMRGSMGGTYFYSEGKLRKMNLKTPKMKNSAVYPRWHPSGKFVAFSSNKTIQQFHAADNKKVDVCDLESTLILYDVEKNEMMSMNLTGAGSSMDTYPEWSPDGKYLYFCRAAAIDEEFDYSSIRYDLYRVSFNEDTRSAGEAEIMFDAVAACKSVAFPRVSPDGKFLVFTLADYGCFPIWHKEADLCSIDLSTRQTKVMDLNSEFTDSYHSWSSNGRWLVFSSKRQDGLTARPYIAYINQDGTSQKPFVLPQKDPGFYGSFLKSFNVPEFSDTRIDTHPGTLRRLAASDAVPAKWVSNLITLMK